MYFKLLLGLAVLTSAATSSLPSEDDEQTAQSCSQNIPEDRSVEIGGECRSTDNCQRSDVSTECVSIRDNYCECKAVDGEVEDRMGKGKKWKKKGKKGKRKWRKKPLCKKFKGHTCSRRFKCKKRYQRRQKRCRHPRHVCCVKCRKQVNHRCVRKNNCPMTHKETQYQCGRKGRVCCSARMLGETCIESRDCPGAHQQCNPATWNCECVPPAWPDGTGECFVCDAGWEQIKLRCYQLGDTAADNPAGVAFCAGLRSDATLATISSQEEEEFITDTFPADVRWWIGLRDINQSPDANNRDWQWDDGTPVDFTSWLSPDPNNAGGSEWCVNGKDGTPTWYDDACTSNRRPLCSYKN